MRVTEIIAHKRDGGALTTSEIDFFIKSVTDGSIEDYQVSAWLMAVYLRGMNHRETTDLTLAMARSGDVLDLSDVLPISVDKHSSGGVGDKTTLIVLPMVAACGIPVAKMSGRGLGFSGGTLDKLEAIPGYRVTLSMAEFKATVQQHGIVLAGQSGNLAPADGKLYALRDATATVQSLPLIASSIMSKKIAAGAEAIVLDVKLGRGAFMKTEEEARDLAKLMAEIGKLAGRRVVALLSDMNQPLGAMVGNTLEVAEAIQLLHGSAPADLYEHCVTVAGHMLRLARRSNEPLEGFIEEAAATLKDGRAFSKFRQMVAAQGGDVSVVENPERLAQAKIIEEYPATQSGYVAVMDAETVGVASVDLGAGRERKSDSIDHAVGLVVHKKVGDPVATGESLFTIHANDSAKLEQAKQRLANAVTYSADPVPPLPTFYGTISSDETIQQP
ncbi:MAG: thymidine phosphorylase [Anaerolineae bacterium]|nr:thymidine phosphorylase [Anaerolineae bacterium]